MKKYKYERKGLLGSLAEGFANRYSISYRTRSMLGGVLQRGDNKEPGPYVAFIMIATGLILGAFALIGMMGPTKIIF